MKISVVTDNAGNVLGAMIPSPGRTRTANSVHLLASESTKVYETDLPLDLFEHIGKKTFASEFLKYRAEKKGKRIALTRD